MKKILILVSTIGLGFQAAPAQQNADAEQARKSMLKEDEFEFDHLKNSIFDLEKKNGITKSSR